MSSQSDNEEKTNESQKGGFHFHSPVTAENQTFIDGNVANLNNNLGLSAPQLQDLAGLFQPLKEQIQTSSPEKRQVADQKVGNLYTELAKGTNANADRLNNIIDGLVELIPGALSTLVSMFVNPILGGLVGPVAQAVLERLHSKKA